MEALGTSWAVVSLISLETAGLLLALAVRCCEHTALQAWCQRFFLLLLLLAGIGTAASLALGPGATLASGSALAVMAVAAVCELRPAANSEAF